jgi:hypothetical protein
VWTLQFFPGVPGPKIPTAHVVGAQKRELCLSKGLTWDTTTNSAVINLQQALKTAIETHRAERRQLLRDKKWDISDVLEICVGTDAAGLGGALKLTTLVAKLPRLAVDPGSKYASHQIGLAAGADSHQNLSNCFGDMLAELRSLKTFAFEGRSLTVDMLQVFDKMCMNSLSGVSTCASTYPCVFCTCPSKYLLDLTRKISPNRTLQDQNVWSHTVRVH